MGQILILEGCDSNQVGWNWDQVEQNQDGPASLGFCWVKGDLCGGEACGGGTSCAGGNSDDRGDHVGRVRGDIVKDDSEEDREDTGRGGVLGGEACEGVVGESREEGEGDAHNEVETCTSFPGTCVVSVACWHNASCIASFGDSTPDFVRGEGGSGEGGDDPAGGPQRQQQREAGRVWE